MKLPWIRLKLNSASVPRIPNSGLLCRYLLERESRDAGPITRVFDRDAADVALSIDIQERILVEVSCLGDFSRSKLDIQRISVLEIFNLHALRLAQAA